MRGRPIFTALFVVAHCVPRYAPMDLTESAILSELARDHRTGCLVAGLSGSVANAGVLACAVVPAGTCSTFLSFPNSGVRTVLTDAINAIGVTHADCLVPASNALTELNSLVLPATLSIRRAGGTPGAHTSSNARVEPQFSCTGFGLDSSTYLAGATRLTTPVESDFLSTARGLVAVRDAGGLCRTALGLNSFEAATAASVVAGTITTLGSCDYGVDDAGKPDCPGNLQRNDIFFGGISSW